MARVQLIENLIRSVLYNDGGYKEVNRNGETVWVATRNGDIFTLLHYNTVICKADIKENTIVEYYGESMSDRNAIGTILEVLATNDTRTVSYSQGIVTLS